MIKLFGTFLEGLLSFFSPCVLPLIPLYVSYLTKDVREKEGETYRKRDVFLMTLLFTAGICLTFVILSLSANYVRDLIEEYKEIAGILTDVGTEEISHQEMIGAILHQLTREPQPSAVQVRLQL